MTQSWKSQRLVAVCASVEAVQGAQLRLGFQPLWQLQTFLSQQLTGGHQDCNLLKLEEGGDVAEDIPVHAAPDDQEQARIGARLIHRRAGLRLCADRGRGASTPA